MKAERLALGLTVANLVLLAVILGCGLPLGPVAGAAQDVVPILRARALEVVDEQGQVRSRLGVESDGEVLLRLFDRTGTIRVKLGAGEGETGLLLLDDAAEPGVQLITKRTGTSPMRRTTSLTLHGTSGAQTLVVP